MPIVLNIYSSNMSNNTFFWISECIAYIPLDSENPTSPINYVNWN